IGSSPVNTLFTERGNYQNFHFRVEARINDRGFAAQCFRSKFAAGRPPGYAAHINSTQTSTKNGPLAWSRGRGLLPLEGQRDTLVKPDVWFVQEVMVDGNHFTVTVNGEIIVDKIDPERAVQFAKGHLALYKDNPGTVVEFRHVEIKELPPTK